MRRMIDGHCSFWDAIGILAQVEQHLGIEIPDEAVEAVCPWEKLTLGDLAEAIERSLPPDNRAVAKESILAAVRAKFPNAADPLDFSAPLHEALGNERRYGGY
jgi:hypothetical protein